MIRLLLVDDQALVRAGIRRLLESSVPDLQIEEASGGEHAFGLLSRSKFDLVFLDISMPGHNGFQTLSRIHREWPNLPVVMLSVHEQRQYVLASVKAGAMGYITKDADPADLALAVSRVVAGSRFYCKTAHRLSYSSLKKGEVPGLSCLTPREIEVFSMLSGGDRVGEIALALNVERKTITSHKRRIFKKMRWGSAYDMYVFLAENGLIGYQDPSFPPRTPQR